MPGLLLLFLRLLLTAALYAFLGWALWLLFQDLRQRSGALAAPAAPPLVLSQVCTLGEITSPADAPVIPQAEPEAALAFRITTAEAILERDSTCQVYADHPTISARHARLAYHHTQWWVEDLHSRNGTWLNDQPVADAVVLTQDDELRCGALVFVVNFE